MDLEKLQRDIKLSYNSKLENIQDRVDALAKHIASEWEIHPNELSTHEIKTITQTVVELETQKLHDEVEALVAQKEQIERALERKAQQLQNAKYEVFDAMEAQLSDQDTQALAKLHQVKLQSIDLFDLLGELVESAIISAMEKDKDSDAIDAIQEVIKDITYEAIKEGPLNTLRIRKILATILGSARELAEASPNQAKLILEPTLKGMRSGLIRSIERFKQRLLYMPVEAKHILIEDYDTIMQDLHQSDSLFKTVIQTQAQESSSAIKEIILNIKKEMAYDLEELLHTSKEAAGVMKERFSILAKEAAKRADSAMHSHAAKEAKRLGAQAFEIAKNALGNAIKSAKDAIDSKK